MTEKDENKIMAVAIGVLVTLIVLCCLCSCGAKKVTTETLYVHDTLRIAHRDTFVVERWNYKRDTVRVESERIVTLLQSDKTLPAETIRIVNNQRYFEREVVRDSSASFISKIDSILRAMDRNHEKEKLTVKKEPPWIERMIFLLLIGLFIYVFLRHRK